ncbi:MAG: indolepyruvate oxidoreductase subunit beta [Clostridiaceae bacterium]|nr:indolepyruvate oxidoreductase subunit beta [Clostridiaceae bacterium]
MKNVNMIIVGVGGQGTLLTSKIIGNAALKESYHVKVSEVHGMSQRGGSVITYVKLGSSVDSPLVEKNEADIIIAFEKLEALRWIEYLKKGGSLVVNDQQINPMPVITGREKYPDNIIEKLRHMCGYEKVIAVDALKIAKELGNTRVVNLVLVGILARLMPFSKEIWLESIKESVPTKYYDVNKKAFEVGFGLM